MQDDMKALYLATHEIAKKWTMPLRNWGKVLGELEIMYPDRLNWCAGYQPDSIPLRSIPAD